MKVIKKTVEATIEPVPDEQASSPNGEFTLILSDPLEDREGDSFKPEEWTTPLPEHISIDTDHGMSVKSTVGSGKPVLQANGEIRVAGTYASTAHAQETRTLVNEGHVRGASVTCLQRISKSGGRTVIKREIINGTITPIPANPRAVILTSKSLNADPADVDETAQAFHDQALELGALCGDAAADVVGKTVTTVVTKGIKGSVEDLQQRVSAAVRKASADREYPWVRATFLDDTAKGTVVYELDGPAGRSGTFARSFTDSGVEVTLDAEVRTVELVTSVVEAQGDNPAAAAATASKTLSPGVDNPVDTNGQIERAIELLTKAAGGMTREAARELLRVPSSGAIVASSEGVTAETKSVTADEAAADTGTAAASPAELRARALLLSIDAAG